MTDVILVILLLAIVGGAIAYIRKEKKRGVNCIGCPSAGTCSRAHAEGGCGCHAGTNE